MDQGSISAFLKARRHELNLSLKEAYRRTGIQPSRLHDLEQGISSTTGKLTAPTRNNITKLARGYEVSEDFLLDLAGRPSLGPVTDEETRLIAHFRELIPGHRGAVLALVDSLYRLDHSPAVSGETKGAS